MRELTSAEVTGLTCIVALGLVLGAKVLIELISMVGDVIQQSFEAGNVEYNDCTFEGLKPAKTDTFTVEIPSHIAAPTHDNSDEADSEHGSLDPNDPRAGGDLSPR